MFNIGDVVQMKSGGPAMTVIETGETVKCMWFADGNETFKTESLPAICLEAIEFEEDTKSDSEDDQED